MLESLYLAYQLVRIAADIRRQHFHRLDFKIRVDNKAAADINPGSFIIYSVYRADSSAGVREHRERHAAVHHLGELLFLPHHVDKTAVRAYGKDFHTQSFIIIIPGSNRCQLRRSHEGKIARIETEDNPFAFVIRELDGLEPFTGDKGAQLKIRRILSHACGHFLYLLYG